MLFTKFSAIYNVKSHGQSLVALLKGFPYEEVVLQRIAEAKKANSSYIPYSVYLAKVFDDPKLKELIRTLQRNHLENVRSEVIGMACDGTVYQYLHGKIGNEYWLESSERLEDEYGTAPWTGTLAAWDSYLSNKFGWKALIDFYENHFFENKTWIQKNVFGYTLLAMEKGHAFDSALSNAIASPTIV
jgi:hypothetical protein